MSDVTGMELLQATLATAPETIVVVMTGNPSVASNLEALRAGAWDYIPKPFSATHLQILIGRAAHTVFVARESKARGTRGGEARAAARTSPSSACRRVPARDGPGPAGRRDRRVGVHHRRERHRQGADRADHPPAQPAQRAADGGGQLRRAAGGAARVGDVRAREGGLHRRGARQDGAARDGQRRHDVPGRTDRHAEVGPGEAAARHPGRRGAARRQLDDQRGGERALHLRVEPRPGAGGERRHAARGPVLPPARRPDPRAAAARARPEDVELLADHFLEHYWRRHRGAAVTLPALQPRRPSRRCAARRGRATCASCRTSSSTRS